ncbi:dienelactone hydrolase family protein [Brachybacterium hainanense]|uniref:Dienelactone hydrolase family protein n=1 Tax=Brachybacterium hainanense TaxID=1541174 RepID=A0ABV6R9D6_9MICO
MTASEPPLPFEIPTDDGVLPGLLWAPVGPSRPRPGVVVLQEIFGLSPYIRQRCADLAALGMVVLAPQLFARLDPPVSDVPDGEDFEAWLGRGMACASALPWERAEADAVAALAALRALPQVDEGRVALLGFCYGGGLAFSAAATASARGDAPAALVSFYGSALPTLLDRAALVDLPSLHLFGTADAFIPIETVQKIRAAVTAEGSRPQVRFELFEGAGHAFDNPHPGLHHAEAAERAWALTESFLRTQLRRSS